MLKIAENFLKILAIFLSKNTLLIYKENLFKGVNYGTRHKQS